MTQSIPLNIDLTNIPYNEGPSSDPLAAGMYSMRIDSVEMKPTKAQDGHYLELQLTVVSATGAGRKVWDRLNLFNKNKQASEIAHKQLSAYGHALGITFVQDAMQLNGACVDVDIVVKPGSGSYGPGNEVRGVYPFGSKAQGGAAPTPAAPAYAPAQQPAPQAAQQWGQPAAQQPPAQAWGQPAAQPAPQQAAPAQQWQQPAPQAAQQPAAAWQPQAAPVMPTQQAAPPAAAQQPQPMAMPQAAGAAAPWQQ